MKLGSYFWWLRIGLIGIWWALSILLIALWAAFAYSDNAIAARFSYMALTYVFVAWIAYTAGRYRSISIRYPVGDEIEHPKLIQDSKGLNGKTIERLGKAIADVPSRYPEYETRQPKLDDDIRPWLKSAYGASDREAHVFGAIISEHFRL